MDSYGRDANLTKALLRQFYWNLIAYLDSVSRSHVCDVVEIGGSTDHLAATVRRPEIQLIIIFQHMTPCGLAKAQSLR